MKCCQSKTVYYPCEEVYEYKPRGLEETEYPEYPYPEVIGYVNNDDGTLTLKAAVFLIGVSKAYIHEVTVRDTKDGSIQYGKSDYRADKQSGDGTYRA